MVNKIAGKKETPPKRETGFLCTFRISGASNNLLRREMVKIRGMIALDIIIANINPPRKIKTTCIFIIFINKSKPSILFKKSNIDIYQLSMFQMIYPW